MDDYSQEQWYQVFDEEYERHNSGHSDEPLETLDIPDDDFGFSVSELDDAECDYYDFQSAESIIHRRACLWDHSWADGSPRLEATVMQAQDLIAAFWRLIDEKDARLQLEVPGVFRCGIPGRRCSQGRGWIGQACGGCGQKIIEHIFTAAELDNWFAEVNVLIRRGLSQTTMARYLSRSFSVGFHSNRDAYESARQCFDGLGDGPVNLAVA